MNTYYIDIDGVICTNTDGDYPLAERKPNNILKVNALFDEGHRIVLWTARGSQTKKDWRALTEWQLEHWGVRYHELRLDKPHYDYIIDDKCTVLPAARATT